MQVWHVTIATVDRMPLFRDERGVRRAVRQLARLEHRPRIWEAVGLPKRGVEPATDAQLRAAGAVRIASAAAAAACADPELRGNATPECEARWAAAQLAKAAGIPNREIAWALGITTRGVRRACRAKVRPTLIRATRLRLAIEEAVARQRRAA